MEGGAVRVSAGGPLEGEIRVPGDKSISHRAAILAGLARGESWLGHYAPGADAATTLQVLEMLGVESTRMDGGVIVRGTGQAGWAEPQDVLDAGNSGTTMRLMAGCLAGQPFYSVLTGDDSLRRRPMDRVLTPLALMGAKVDGREGGRYAPLGIRGGRLRGITYQGKIASAQVKSAILLAGLWAEGETVYSEPVPSRDHTERLLPAFGVAVVRDGTTCVVSGDAFRLHGLHPVEIEIPGDLSGAAFYMVAASLVPGSRVHLPGIGLNPGRTGVIDVLRAMGADIQVANLRWVGQEPVGDLTVSYKPLHGTTLGGELVVQAIDEIPVLMVAATQAEGETRLEGAAELRVKETDRLAGLASELRALGAAVTELADGLVVHGPVRLKGTTVTSYGDHRLAMALAVAGLVADGTTVVEGAQAIGISDPGFFAALRELGAAVG